MSDRPYVAAALTATLALLAPSALAQGQILITQAKALAGNVTPGDTTNFPVTLSLPGSYILGTNLSPGHDRSGIVVTSPDVSIDLNGFRLSGGPAGGTNNALRGIVGLGDRLTVKNGTIGAFEGAGIHAPSRDYLIVENMRILNNGGIGIDATASSFTRIQNNTVATNRNTGIYCHASCHVEGNIVSGNSGLGIRMHTGIVLGNTVVSNTGLGLSSNFVVAFGNNAIINNNGGASQQIEGVTFSLHPNMCFPGTC